MQHVSFRLAERRAIADFLIRMISHFPFCLATILYIKYEILQVVVHKCTVLLLWLSLCTNNNTLLKNEMLNQTCKELYIDWLHNL